MQPDLTADGFPPSDSPVQLSLSVRQVWERFGGEPVSALQLVQAICIVHPGYGAGRARLADRLRVSDAEPQAHVIEWVDRVADMFDPPVTEMFGRLLLAGLAGLQPEVGRAMARIGLLQAVLVEIRPVPTLRTTAHQAWERDLGDVAPWPSAPGSSNKSQQAQVGSAKTGDAYDVGLRAPLGRSAQTILAQMGGSERIAAPTLVAALFDLNPQYAEGRALVWGTQASAPHRTIPEWLHLVETIFDPLPDALHARLICTALALLDEAAGHALVHSELLVPLASRIRNAPALTPEFEKVWSALTGLSWDEITNRLPFDEAVPAHSDDPAKIDQLGRRPFAEVIAARMDEVWAGQRAKRKGGDALGAFMVHVHGPWGSGKSSVLNFLRERLQDEARREDDRWVVVDFNAWRHQRIRPPWWSLIREIYAQSSRDLGFLHSLRLRARWFWWRFRADWLPAASAVLLIVAAVALTVGAIAGAVPDDSAKAGTAGDDLAKSVELALKVVMAVLAAFGAVLAAGRTLAFGSAKAAQAYTDLRSDPLGPIVRLFEKLVREIGRPVAVFVDDLDRCDGAYVVELLEGIQTLFRTAPVTYVIAADRKWICSSFEKHYGDFGPTIGEPGRPLGYLFLDKLFQVSASVPRPPRERQDSYWKSLLRAAGSSDPVAIERKQREIEQRVETALTGAATPEQMERRIERLDPHDQQAARNVAARLITASPEAQRATEHRLQRFAALLEPNPRAMKRLVNAFGLHQAAHLIEGRQVRPEALARWTIVELRWPLLADYLSDHPHAVAAIGGEPPADAPEALKPLFEQDPEVRRVVHGAIDGAIDGAVPLDEPAIRRIVGDPGASAGSPSKEAQKQIPAGIVQQIQPSADSAESRPSQSSASDETDETDEADASSVPPEESEAIAQAPTQSA